MATDLRRLYLFDCDGGRGSLFSELQQDQIPKNYQLYLFWNNIEEGVTNKLQQLKIHKNIHLAPSHLQNVKNSADGKLIYFLGKLASQFDTITIVGGGDRVYEEVIEAVSYDYPKKEITLKKIERPNSSELDALLDLFPSKVTSNLSRKNAELVTGILLGERSIIICSIDVISTRSNRCPECLNNTREFFPIGLRQHLLMASQHSKDIKDVSKSYCNIRENEICCSKGKIKLIYSALERVFETPKKSKKCPLCLDISKSKYKAITLYKHLQAEHPECRNVKIQCCNEQIMYNNLDEFRQHVLNDPFQMTYEVYA